MNSFGRSRQLATNVQHHQVRSVALLYADPRSEALPIDTYFLFWFVAVLSWSLEVYRPFPSKIQAGLVPHPFQVPPPPGQTPSSWAFDLMRERMSLKCLIMFNRSCCHLCLVCFGDIADRFLLGLNLIVWICGIEVPPPPGPPNWGHLKAWRWWPWYADTEFTIPGWMNKANSNSDLINKLPHAAKCVCVYVLHEFVFSSCIYIIKGMSCPESCLKISKL